MKKLTTIVLVLVAIQVVKLSAQPSTTQPFANVYEMNIMVGYNNTFTFAIKTQPVSDIFRTNNLIGWMDTTIDEHKIRIYTIHILEKSNDVVKDFKNKAGIDAESYYDLDAKIDSSNTKVHTDVPGIYPFAISMSDLGTGFTLSNPSASFDWRTMDSFSDVNFGSSKVGSKKFAVKMFSFYIAAWDIVSVQKLRKLLTGE